MILSLFQKFIYGSFHINWVQRPNLKLIELGVGLSVLDIFVILIDVLELVLQVVHQLILQIGEILIGVCPSLVLFQSSF